MLALSNCNLMVLKSRIHRRTTFSVLLNACVLIIWTELYVWNINIVIHIWNSPVHQYPPQTILLDGCAILEFCLLANIYKLKTILLVYVTVKVNIFSPLWYQLNSSSVDRAQVIASIASIVYMVIPHTFSILLPLYVLWQSAKRVIL